ncbi:CD209 antigen-like protein E isoform X2 [Toxotes jaculatrix]|uniref:CD209 antigen-like protein E isoform X2 n=1 Tax=Toxotes jaculatrix TaxID=941984 RepID=UPI001B3AA1F2|nr:CD209 antigen-like protein E isoform X2 [Toxotes jaculatrix]
MQRMEMPDYLNERPRRGRKRSTDVNQSVSIPPAAAQRRNIQVLFLCFGGLFIIQAILNVSLRLTLYSNKELPPSDCNTTSFKDQNQEKEMRIDCEQGRPSFCNVLHERFCILTREKKQLEDRNTELMNTLKNVEDEKNRLEIIMRELSGCVSYQQCPPGWREINSRCYFLSDDIRTWEESRKDCKSKLADLVVISSEQEERALYQLNGEGVLLFWIGLHGTNGTFRWVNGAALTESFWQLGQPDHGGPNNREDCVEMYHNNPVLHTWNDAPCEHKQRWLCERDPCIS